MASVVNAIRKYVLEHDDMPTPSDLKKILDEWTQLGLKSEYDSQGFEVLTSEDEERNAAYFRD